MHLIISVILLFLILPGCLARYGEGRLDQLLTSVNDLEKECESNHEGLTEERIKEKLGRPGFLKPVYECDLNVSFLHTLEKDAGVLLIPNRSELYEDMLTSVRRGKLTGIKLLSYVYDRMGSREDASLTFYIGYCDSATAETPVVFGWDYADYDDKEDDDCKERRSAFINYTLSSPSDYLRLPFSLVIDAVIGLKQFAGEIVKSPISLLEAELFENLIIERKIPFYKFDGFKAAAEDWRNGVTALTYRFRVDGNQGMVASARNLLGELPLIGSVFDQWHKKESPVTKHIASSYKSLFDQWNKKEGGVAHKLFLTRGIFGGDDSAQNVSLWADYLRQPSEECSKDISIIRSGNPISYKPDFTEIRNTHPYIKAIPYRYGSNIDVLWALFNISHGYAYDMASEIVMKNSVNPGDSVLLSGHSGGVQRIISTARILFDDGIKVNKIYGIAGPALGYSPCKDTKVVLNSKPLQDPVSDISRFLRYITLDLLTLNIKWDYDDRELTNRDDTLFEHITPGFVDGKTRLKYDGYLCENYLFFLN